MKTVKLGDVPVGDLVVWRTRMFGEVLAQVKHHFETLTLVLADNDMTYEWTSDMIVEVDD